jgi:cell division protease FtsH
MTKPKTPPKKTPVGDDPEQETNPLRTKTFWMLVLLALGAILAINLLQHPPGAKTIPYSEVKEHIRAGDVSRVVLQDSLMDAQPTDEARKRQPESARFTYWRALRPDRDDALLPLLEEKKVPYEVRVGCEGSSSSVWIWIGPLLLLMFFWNTTLRRLTQGQGSPPAMDFAKSRAKLYVEEGVGITFNDVAGCDEAKEELQEVVEFLKEPERFSRLGGRVPKGVLLVGPPGTGKTLLARAVAGEAKVAFFNLSGSDFVEMFVGVGAARVRDLFKQAQEQAPCIIFVDELDAIGKARAANNLHGNDEREQTLNAMLVEMDGFDSRSGVIILAATNRPEILDRALLRPGRFDRQVLVDPPDVRGRESILKVHARAVSAAPDVDLQKIAAQTPGFVGADLANVVNEAALLAARQNKDAVYMVDFQEAIERVMAGVEKRSRRLSEHEKNIVAYHEAGHAIVAKAVKHADPVHKVSIVSRGLGALGYTLQVPTEDRYLMTKAELEDRIAVLLGGRAAEQIIFRDVSTGASNDLQRVSGIARSMILDYGMSLKVGTLSLGDRGNSESLIAHRSYSEQTAEVIDAEMRELVEHHYRRTLAVLEQNIDVLHAMADKLKQDEVLDGEALAEMLGRVHFDEPTNTSRDGHL